MSDSGPDATPSGLSAGDSSDVTRPEVSSSVADSSVDASEASPPACSHTIAEGCIPNPPFLWANGSTVDFNNCPPTWNDAIAACIAYAADFGYQETDCGPYRRWHVENGDVGCSYYYDAASGDLVSVFCTGFMGDVACLGGPLGSTEPPCAPLQLQNYGPCAPGDEMEAGRTASDAASEAGSDAADTCTVTADCPPGQECFYRIGDCSAKGECLSLGPVCNIAVGCSGCSDGHIVEGLCGQPSYAYGPALSCSQ
jgi:hypothetical protein